MARRASDSSAVHCSWPGWRTGGITLTQPSASSSASMRKPLSARAAGGSCTVDQKQLYQCLEENGGSAAACQYFFDALKLCQDNAQYAQQYGQ